MPPAPSHPVAGLAAPAVLEAQSFVTFLAVSNSLFRSGGERVRARARRRARPAFDQHSAGATAYSGDTAAIRRDGVCAHRLPEM